jgi:putative membrane protein insertion efficiency factor
MGAEPAQPHGGLRRLGSWLWRAPAGLLMGLVRAYRLLLKPWLGNACRFEPSCSAYTLQALQQHGASGGIMLGGWRLLRCQPWCEGGCDPVPDHHPLRGVFTGLVAGAASSARAPQTAQTEPTAVVPPICAHGGAQPASAASPSSSSSLSRRQSSP